MVRDDPSYTKAARKRQQRWRKRRQAEGRRSLTVMVSTEAKQIFDEERARSGETLAQVIERAAFALSKGNVPGAPSPVKVESDGKTLTVAVSLDRLSGPAPRIDASEQKRAPADVLLKRLISKKDPR
ncbi:MAG: hypothetical protein PVG78_07875 [Desulfobacterales bacterium]|jgi:hypothetical protein